MLGPVTIIAVLSGQLKLGVYGFGMVVLCQSIWFITVGVLRFRGGAAEFAGAAPQLEIPRK
jgi:hypothetical protein